MKASLIVLTLIFTQSTLALANPPRAYNRMSDECAAEPGDTYYSEFTNSLHCQQVRAIREQRLREQSAEAEAHARANQNRIIPIMNRYLRKRGLDASQSSQADYGYDSIRLRIGNEICEFTERTAGCVPVAAQDRR